MEQQHFGGQGARGCYSYVAVQVRNRCVDNSVGGLTVDRGSSRLSFCLAVACLLVAAIPSSNMGAGMQDGALLYGLMTQRW